MSIIPAVALRIPPLPGHRPPPLSFAQKPLWCLDRRGAGGTYSVGAVSARLQGGLDAAALRRALLDIAGRHAALRTRFADFSREVRREVRREVETADRPAQIVSDTPAVPFLLVDLAALPAAAGRAEARRRAEGLAATPFDLTRGPLLRAALFRLGAAEHFFYLSIHPIVFDGWSRRILHRELAVLYLHQAGPAGQSGALPLPPLALQPAELAWRQRLALRDPAVIAPLRDYWRRQLAGLPLLALPTDRPRPAVRRHRGAWQPVAVPAGVAARLTAFCRDERATLFMAAWVAFALLLGRLAGSTDVAVGHPIAGRDVPDDVGDVGDVGEDGEDGSRAEGLIGCFSTILVLRADLSGDPSWRALVARHAEVALAAFDHRALPFAQRIDERVQAVFALQNAPDENRQIPGLAVTDEPLATLGTRFDLALCLGPDPDGGLGGTLKYDTDLFQPATARRFAAAYATLVAAVLDAPDRPLSSLDLLAPAERRQLLREGSGEDGASAVEQRLAGLWRQVLGRADIGRHERFFDLGGDSLLALQVVARANRAGLALTVRQLLAHPTLAALGRVVAATSTVEDPSAAEQGWVSGPVPLTPGQRWFFDRVLPGLAAPHAFSTPALFALRQPLPAARAAEVVLRLAFQHDALRLRVRRGAGGWEQWLPGREGLAGLFACVDHGALPAGRQDEALSRVARCLLDQGELAGTPLARGVHLPGGETGDRLLLVLHHLVSDEASWRLLGEDLETLCGQAAGGHPLHLPAKTTSFRRWAEHQAGLARSPELRRQMEDWLGWAALGAAALPTDGRGGDFAAAKLSARLPATATRTLLETLPAATGAPFTSALLAAIARALAAWTGAEHVLIRQTHHGRDPDLPGVNLSRTVGWISTTAPVLLHPGPPDAPASEAIARIDAQLRQVPLRGLGYGLLRYLSGDELVARRMESVVASPLGTFNFLGRADVEPNPAAALRRLPLPHWRPPSLAITTPQLRLTAAVEGQPAQLVLSVAWGTGFYRRETIVSLAERMQEELLALLPAASGGEGGAGAGR